MRAEDQARLRLILDSFDEAGLVALANKGLVRRAAKDAETGGMRIEESDDMVVVVGPGWQVRMPPEGPTAATDDTKATGVTRQILAATMFLRDQWRPAAAGGESREPEEPGGEQPQRADRGAAPERQTAAAAGDQPPSDHGGKQAEAALLDLTLNELQRWSGKAVFDEAMQLLQKELAVEVERHAGLTLRWPELQIEVRLLPGDWGRSKSRLLDQVITSAPKPLRKVWVAAAVLQLHRLHGRPIGRVEAPARQQEGAVRSRTQVLQSATRLLLAMVSAGIAHPSDRLVQQLFTLSVSALGARLPRLGRLLRTLADEVNLAVERHAQADLQRLFDRLALTYALVSALQSNAADAAADLEGKMRSEYELVGDLRLVGVGAYPWETASGYMGLTALFWSIQRARWYTWSFSRPADQLTAYELERVYHVEPVWNGGSVSRMCRSRFVLRRARSNAAGRLSTSSESSVDELGEADYGDVDFGGRAFDDWSQLQQTVGGQLPLGLVEPGAADRYLILRPNKWGTRAFDELQQRFLWQLGDTWGGMLTVSLAWRRVAETAIDFLESTKPDRERLSGLVVQVTTSDAGAMLEPVALFSAGTTRGDRLLDPAFDLNRIESRQSALLERLRQKYSRDQISTRLTLDDDAADLSEPELPADLSGNIRLRFAQAESLAQQLAERGAQSLTDSDRQRAEQLRSDAQRAGWRQLAAAIQQLLDQQPLASQVLRLRYVVRLHRQAIQRVIQRQFASQPSCRR